MTQPDAERMRQIHDDDSAVEVSTDPTTGLPLVRIGRTVTSADVQGLDDE